MQSVSAGDLYEIRPFGRENKCTKRENSFLREALFATPLGTYTARPKAFLYRGMNASLVLRCVALT